MRKNINKLVAVAIGVSIMSGSALPVFAADATAITTNTSATTVTTTQNTSASTVTSVQAQTKPVLTLDDAITAAVNNSDSLTLQEKYVKLQEDQLDIEDEIDDNGFPYDRLELVVKKSKEQKDFLEDQIAQDITNKYNEIVTKGKELDKVKKKIEVGTKEFKDSELKNKLGLLTAVELKNKEIDIQNLKNNQKDIENKLKNKQDYFKVLTDKDLSKYVLEQDIKFESFKIDGSADEYFDNVIEKYLKYDEEILKLTKDDAKDHAKSKPNKDDSAYNTTTTDPVTKVTTTVFNKNSYNSALRTYGGYLTDKYNNSLDTVTLDTKKKNIKDGLKDKYATLLDLENKINVMKSSTSVDNKQISIAKLKYDLGLITKTEYNKEALKLEKEDLEVTLRGYIEEYNKQKNYIQKPWLLYQ